MRLKKLTSLYPMSMLRRMLIKENEKFFLRQLRPTDVFIVGHPKSGNTWLTYMLAIVCYKDSWHRITLANLANYIPFMHGDDKGIVKYANLRDPRIFRNEQPVYPELYPKTIYMVRDPRSVLVSYYHHYRTVTNDIKTSFEVFVEDYLLHGYIRNFDANNSRWDKQVLEWIERTRKDERVMIVRYEDMVRDRKHVLKKVVEYTSIPCAGEDITLAVNRGGFEAMCADEENHGAESYPGEIGKRGRFIRQGKADGWQEEMPSDLAKRIENEFAEAMKGAGYL